MTVHVKKNIYKIAALLLGCLAFAACGDESETGRGKGAKPTVVVVAPSITPTSTPSPFPTATATPAVTPTPTPLPDYEPPVIIGAEDLEAKVNGTISYTRNVTATDNSGEVFTFRGEDPNLWVDKSGVNMAKAGTYTAVYHAKDSAGNESTAEIRVLVSKASPDEVFARADQVLERIVTEDMTLMQKAEAIFKYVHKNIGYQEKKGSDYLESAYYGLEEHIGDCNVFAATAKVLLTRAGIPNIDIRKYPDNNDPHVWNLVNCGEGWYHFDTTVWHPDTADKEARENGIFMWKTEDFQKSGSKAIRTQHVFDASLYPEIQ